MSVSSNLLCSFELLKPLDSSALKSHIKKGRNARQNMLNSPVCTLCSLLQGMRLTCPLACTSVGAKFLKGAEPKGPNTTQFEGGIVLITFSACTRVPWRISWIGSTGYNGWASKVENLPSTYYDDLEVFNQRCLKTGGQVGALWMTERRETEMG